MEAYKSKWGMSTSSTESTILNKNDHGVDDLKLSSTPAKDDVRSYTLHFYKKDYEKWCQWKIKSNENSYKIVFCLVL